MLAFFRILAVRVAYSRVASLSAPPMQAMQRNRIAFAFPPPIITHRTGFWTSPALLLLLRICLPTCQTYRRSLPFLVWLISQRKTACSETRGNHSPVARTPPPHQKLTSLICPDGYRHHPPVFQSVATHDPLPFPRSDSPDFSHADATIVPLPPTLPTLLQFRPSITSVGRSKSTMPTAISGALSAIAT